MLVISWTRVQVSQLFLYDSKDAAGTFLFLLPPQVFLRESQAPCLSASRTWCFKEPVPCSEACLSWEHHGNKSWGWDSPVGSKWCRQETSDFTVKLSVCTWKHWSRGWHGDFWLWPSHGGAYNAVLRTGVWRATKRTGLTCWEGQAPLGASGREVSCSYRDARGTPKSKPTGLLNGRAGVQEALPCPRPFPSQSALLPHPHRCVWVCV